MRKLVGQVTFFIYAFTCMNIKQFGKIYEGKFPIAQNIMTK